MYRQGSNRRLIVATPRNNIIIVHMIREGIMREISNTFYKLIGFS